jgi:hypothetical protein
MATSTPKRWRNRLVEFTEIDPEQLLANPNNWRIHPNHQREALASVIDEVGFVDPVIVQAGTDLVIDGHLRTALAISEGQPTIPIQYVDLDDEEANYVLMSLDPIGSLAVTDKEKLEELRDLVDLEDGPALDMVNRLIEQDQHFHYGTMESEPDDQDDTAEAEDQPVDKGKLLDLMDITIDEPKTQTHKGQVWELKRPTGAPHLLFTSALIDGWQTWAPELTEGDLFVAFPGTFAPLSLRAEKHRLVMVQPALYVAGHILDRWIDVHGPESVRLRS